MDTLERVTQQITDLHNFFTDWFNGTIERDQLEPRFLSNLDSNFVLIPPEGHILLRPTLEDSFVLGYGTNPNFQTHIRDVMVRHEVGNCVIATYTEWQRGASHSGYANNGRATSVFMDIDDHVNWRHVHETWLPNSLQNNTEFNS